MMISDLDLSYAHASAIMLRQGEVIRLVLVGCGGTGSWLAPSVVRAARLLKEKFQKKAAVVFIDPDHVEAKNIYRQNFCDREIGQPKAVSLAWRFGLAWGVEIEARVQPFRADDWRSGGDLTVLIGCVDGPEGRREIHNYAMHSAATWWLDCGNFKSAGQVLIGRGGARPGKPFEFPGYCTWLPLPSEQHPELIVEGGGEGRGVEGEGRGAEGEGMSCADMALMDSQGLAINQRVAAEASDYLVRLLITHDLTRMATYLDLPSGSSRSVYITPEAVCKP